MILRLNLGKGEELRVRKEVCIAPLSLIIYRQKLGLTSSLLGQCKTGVKCIQTGKTLKPQILVPTLVQTGQVQNTGDCFTNKETILTVYHC